MDAHLTTASLNEQKGGFEIYRFSISRHIVPSMAKKMARLPNEPPDLIIKETMVKFYCKPNPPTAQEVLEVTIKPDHQRSELVTVTMIIKRGHWEVAAWLREMPLAMVSVNAQQIEFWSEGRLVKTLPVSSLP